LKILLVISTALLAGACASSKPAVSVTTPICGALPSLLTDKIERAEPLPKVADLPSQNTAGRTRRDVIDRAFAARQALKAAVKRFEIERGKVEAAEEAYQGVLAVHPTRCGGKKEEG
jgi:hypothetical protein